MVSMTTVNAIIIIVMVMMILMFVFVCIQCDTLSVLHRFAALFEHSQRTFYFSFGFRYIHLSFSFDSLFVCVEQVMAAAAAVTVIDLMAFFSS